MKITEEGDQQLCAGYDGASYSCPDGFSCIELYQTPLSSTVSFDNVGSSLYIAFLVSLVVWHFSIQMPVCACEYRCVRSIRCIELPVSCSERLAVCVESWG